MDRRTNGDVEGWMDGWNRGTRNSGETRKRGGDIDDLSRIEHAMGSPWSAPSPSESKSFVAAWYIMPSHSTCMPQMWLHQIATDMSLLLRSLAARQHWKPTMSSE